MKIDRYEIDMLDVKNADAFLIHFFTEEGNEYIVLVDGGNYDDGDKIIQFIHDNYRQQYIDLAICTHCDKDHFGGLMNLLQKMKDKSNGYVRIDKIWIHDPGRHSKDGIIQHNNGKEVVDVKARSVFDMKDSNLWDILDDLIKDKRIKWAEPFSDAKGENQESNWFDVLKVVGPTVDYYSRFVPDFRDDTKKKKNGYDFEEQDEINIEEEGGSLSKQMDEIGDDTSSHNRPSVITLFTPYEGAKYLFTGDACRESFEKLRDQTLYNSLSKLTWLKVPHHGSIYNLDSDLIKHLRPETAYISSEKYGHYLSKAVVNSLKKVGTKLFATNINGSMCHVHKMTFHKGYTSAKPL